jgi:hypothetical protein
VGRTPLVINLLGSIAPPIFDITELFSGLPNLAGKLRSRKKKKQADMAKRFHDQLLFAL